MIPSRLESPALPARRRPPPKRLLVLRFGAVGDVVLTTPALQALAQVWPDTEIVYGTRRPFVSLIERDPLVHQVMAVEPGEGVWSYSRRLQAIGPDEILDLHGELRSQALRWILRLPTVVVQRRAWQDELPVRLGWRPWRASIRYADRFHDAAERLVGMPLLRGELRHVVDARTQEEADAVLSAAGLQPGTPMVMLAPGANWATKRWPVQEFGRLGQRIDASGLRVVVLGSPDEAPLAAAIAEFVPNLVDLCAASPLWLLGGLLRRARALVANDSGPMHLGRALGVPTVAIFGSTDPGQFEMGAHAAMFAGVPCSPCHFYGRSACPRTHLDCLNHIRAEAVWSELEPRLALGRVPPVQA